MLLYAPLLTFTFIKSQADPSDTQATGQFGGAAVGVAIARGAPVIAMGRNEDTLQRLADTFGSSGRLTTVPLTGTLEGDTSALRAASPTGFSAFLDLSPPAAATQNTYFPAALSLLQTGGRVAVMGGVGAKREIPCDLLVHNDLKIVGKFMYSRDQLRKCIRMAESGVLPLGERAGVVTKGAYGLESIGEAVEAARNEGGWGKQALLTFGKGIGE